MGPSTVRIIPGGSDLLDADWSVSRTPPIRLSSLTLPTRLNHALTKQLQPEAHCRHRAVLLGEQRTAWPEPNEQAATATIIDYTADSDTANPIYRTSTNCEPDSQGSIAGGGVIGGS